jgi:hypothetical protein
MEYAALIAVLAFVAAFLAGMAIIEASQQTAPNENEQPTTTESRDDNQSQRGIIQHNTSQSSYKGNNEGHWYDHITDGLIALFNGLLVLATIALFISAEKSADAAKKSAEIAERALIAGQRAFVSVSFEPSANMDLASGHITAWSFTPVWYNAGDTPTREMQNHINFLIFDGQCLVTGISQTCGLQIRPPTLDCQRHSELRQRAPSEAKRLAAFLLIKCVKSLLELNGSTCGDGPAIAMSFPKHRCM